MKNVPLFIHMPEVDHKERFFPLFFLSVSKNIFPSVPLTQNLTGTLAECYFALALTLKYSMNFKSNEMHWERGGFLVFLCSPCYLLCERDKRKKILVLLLTSGSAAFQSLHAGGFHPKIPEPERPLQLCSQA